jgi:ubiquinone/menaquinone biosynthesis C-methylase UbiE
MTIALATLVILVLLFVAISILWRFASRRFALPCPALLAGTLEGSVADFFAGTEKTLERMRLAPGQTILEVGPGPGRLLIPASFRILPGGKAIGIDLQPKMLARLEARAKQAGVTNMTAMQGNATRLELPDNSVDLAYLSTVLGEIPDRAAALAECFRVVKPGGTLCITEIIGDPHYQSRTKVRELCEQAGFALEEIEGGWRIFTASFRKP